MKQYTKSIYQNFAVLILLLLVLFSCNKIYDPIGSIEKRIPGDSLNTLSKKIATNGKYTILNAGLIRTGLNIRLDNPDAKFTIFAPTDSAFNALGITLNVINALPLNQLTPLLSYHVIPNEIVRAASIPSSFPNIQRGTALDIASRALVTGVPTTSIPIKMTAFPSRRTDSAWINNIPVVAKDDIVASNGVVHGIALIMNPPTKILAQDLQADPDFTFLLAAVARADSGLLTDRSPSFQYALSEPLANLTVFAPTNNAFRTILTTLITQALVRTGIDQATAALQAAALSANPTVFSNPVLYPVLTAQVVRALIAYHILGSRAFPSNFSSLASNYPTLLNLNPLTASHPGITVSSSFTGRIATGLQVRGTLNPLPTNAIPKTAGGPVENLYVNGIYYKIDQVLIPFLP